MKNIIKEYENVIKTSNRFELKIYEGTLYLTYDMRKYRRWLGQTEIRLLRENNMINVLGDNLNLTRGNICYFLNKNLNELEHYAKPSHCIGLG